MARYFPGRPHTGEELTIFAPHVVFTTYVPSPTEFANCQVLNLEMRAASQALLM